MPPVASRYVACSPACGKLWGQAKRYLSEEEYTNHREANAKSVLRNAHKYPPSLINWAEAVLGPNPPEPNRRFRVPGSSTTRAVEEAENLRNKSPPTKGKVMTLKLTSKGKATGAVVSVVLLASLGGGVETAQGSEGGGISGGAAAGTGSGAAPEPERAASRPPSRPAASRSMVPTVRTHLYPATGTGSEVRNSTAYCLTGTMANGQRASYGSVAVNGVPLGTRYLIQTGTWAGRIVTVRDRIGNGSAFDIAMPGNCGAARSYGRRNITVSRLT